MFVYIWKRPDGTPFYVGMTKSIGRTNPLNNGNRNWLCKNTLIKIGPKNVVVEVHIVDTVEEAQTMEQELILKYGRIQLSTGPLTNLKPGGDGSSGMSEEGRASLSKRMKENNPVFRPEVRAKIKARMSDPDIKIKFLGENNPAKRPEVREKIKAKWADPEYKKEQTLKRIGRKIHSEAEIERRRQKLLDPNNPMREYHKVLNSDPDIKAKRVAALRSPEVQEKIKAKLNDPEAKARRLAKLRETIASPEYQAKLALRKKPKPPKKTKEEISKIRSENMRKLNADKVFAEKRLTGLKEVTEKKALIQTP